MENNNTKLQTVDVEAVTSRLLKAVADIDGKVQGAFNLRRDGGTVERSSTKNITIQARADGKPGIDVIVKLNRSGFLDTEQLHAPCLIALSKDAGLCIWTASVRYGRTFTVGIKTVQLWKLPLIQCGFE